MSIFVSLHFHCWKKMIFEWTSKIFLFLLAPEGMCPISSMISKEAVTLSYDSGQSGTKRQKLVSDTLWLTSKDQTSIQTNHNDSWQSYLISCSWQQKLAVNPINGLLECPVPSKIFARSLIGQNSGKSKMCSLKLRRKHVEYQWQNNKVTLSCTLKGGNLMCRHAISSYWIT